jgi:hypothetical protein
MRTNHFLRIGRAMSDQVRISAKNLGTVAMPNSCPRCLWVKLRLRDKLPFQTFPGIFNAIDAYTKRSVHRLFDTRGGPPDWLVELGDVVSYEEPPHFTKFQIVDEDYNILLTGTPDGVFVRSDKSHVIVDYKTARFTGTQDRLFPMYQTQLNAYALIGERRGLAPVTGLALIYMEPVTADSATADVRNRRTDGFALAFSAKVVTVPIDQALVRAHLAKTRQVYELAYPPPVSPGCTDCELTGRLRDLVGG